MLVKVTMSHKLKAKFSNNNNNNNNLICIAPVCAKKTSVALYWAIVVYYKQHNVSAIGTVYILLLQSNMVPSSNLLNFVLQAVCHKSCIQYPGSYIIGCQCALS